MAPELMTLHEPAAKLVGLIGYNYLEIDLNTQVITCTDMQAHFQDEQVAAMNIGQSYLDGDNIIFMSLGPERNPFGSHKLVAFSILTKKVVWQHHFPVMLRRPQVQDGRIFVVDDNKVLHVFEREDWIETSATPS